MLVVGLWVSAFDVEGVLLSLQGSQDMDAVNRTFRERELHSNRD